jgi:DNA-binding protein HU-beta
LNINVLVFSVINHILLTKNSKKMNKSQLIDAIAEKANLTKADVAKAVNAYHEVVKTAIKDGDNVGVVGFGTFSAAERKARTGRNPKTGAVLKIKAAKVPKFRAGKALRDSLN